MELYVKGLPVSMDDQQLRQLFQSYGPSRVKAIKNHDTRQCRGFGYVTIGDEEKAKQAIRKLHGMTIGGRQLQVSEARPRGDNAGGQANNQLPNPAPQPRQQGGRAAAPPPAGSNYTSPYTFTARPVPEKAAPERLHDRPAEGCFDIAFEVEWKALTPVAANPCSEGQATCPLNNEKEYQGYDKRWLIVDGRLAISPFTVKSAIANGVAALLGSCYRVEQKKVPHKAEPATFQCDGAWRRYRVGMDHSKPGLLDKIDYDTGQVSVIPVTEFFYDQDSAPKAITLKRCATYYVTSKKVGKKNIIDENSLSDSPFAGATEVFYYGEYRFGMDLSFGPGEFGKHHYHRFYRIDSEIPLTGKINPLNLKPRKAQEKEVYMGVFRQYPGTQTPGTPRYDHRVNMIGNSWHQHLEQGNPEFKPGKWVYYQAFQDGSGKQRIAAIGLNFQFKTAFHLHDDAVPEAQHTCTNRNLLCPRCALFGMIEEAKGRKGDDGGGLRGRFKSAALLGPKIVSAEPVTACVDGQQVYFRRWGVDGKEVAGQFLLPIQGQAKANKRDIQVKDSQYQDIVSGYFDYQTGKIRGAKDYLHGALEYEDIPAEFTRRTSAAKYTHSMRNYAMICKDGITFSGTLGVENCSVDEAAALLLLLEHNLAQHGFKIGLAKSMGLGSMTSTVKTVWLRKAAGEQWQSIAPSAISLSGVAADKKKKTVNLAELQAMKMSGNSWPELLKAHIPSIKEALGDLKKVQDTLSRTDGREGRTLGYPSPGNAYWGDFARNAAR
jgi:hypothetical protein